MALSQDSVQNGSNIQTKAGPSCYQKKSTFLSLYWGVSNYLGDLGGNKGIGRKFIYDNNSKQRNSFIGFSISHIRKEALGIRLSYMSGNIAGSDQDASFSSKADNAYTRYKRNLDFRSKISEWALTLEAFPLKYFSCSKNIFQWNIQPYLLLGIGRYKFNPQGSYFDEISDDYIWVDLAPLMTEGQGMKEYPDRKPYSLNQWNIPYGIGLQYSLGSKSNLSFEFVGRKLFTDYLDDVSTAFINPTYFSDYLNQEDAEIALAINNKSNLIDPDHPYQAGEQRGNPSYNDFYYSFNLKLSVQINKRKTKTIREAPIPSKPKWDYYKYDNSEICR